MRNTILTGAIAALVLSAGSAMAQDKQYYVSGSIGVNGLSDSDNEGEFSRGFGVSGTGTALDGATLPSGTDVGWTTEFDSGLTYGAAAGADYGAIRFEIELARANNDVDTHSGVFAGDVDLDPVDAAVLIEAQDTQLGATTGDIVADGQGELSTTYLMVNGFYDFDTGTQWTPYVGAGIGWGFVEVDYSPSDIAIFDDSDTQFAYQIIGGVDYALNAQSSLFGQTRYRGTTDIEVESALFPAELEIENRGFTAEVGYRFNF